MKIKHGVHFWYECKSHNVHPKLVHGVKIKKKRKAEAPITTIKIRKKPQNNNNNNKQKPKTLAEENFRWRIIKFYPLDKKSFGYLSDKTTTKQIMR